MVISGDIWLSIISTIILLFITVSLDWGSKQVVSAREIISRIEKEFESEPIDFKLKIRYYINEYNNRHLLTWGVDLVITSITINSALFIMWALSPKKFLLPEIYPSFVEINNTTNSSSSVYSGCSESLINGLIFWGESFFILISLLILSISLKNYCEQRTSPKNSSQLSQWFSRDIDISKLKQHFFNYLMLLLGVLSLLLVLYSLFYGVVS